MANTKSGSINNDEKKKRTKCDSRGWGESMTTQYVTADELVDTLGVSKEKTYQIIRRLNEELAEQGYIKIAGKCPRKYFEKRYYGYTSEG